MNRKIEKPNFEKKIEHVPDEKESILNQENAMKISKEIESQVKKINQEMKQKLENSPVKTQIKSESVFYSQNVMLSENKQIDLNVEQENFNRENLIKKLPTLNKIEDDQQLKDKRLEDPEIELKTKGMNVPNLKTIPKIPKRQVLKKNLPENIDEQPKNVSLQDFRKQVSQEIKLPVKESQRINIEAKGPQGIDIMAREFQKMNLLEEESQEEMNIEEIESQKKNLLTREHQKMNITSREFQGENVLVEKSQGMNLLEEESQEINITAKEFTEKNLSEEKPQGVNIAAKEIQKINFWQHLSQQTSNLNDETEKSNLQKIDSIEKNIIQRDSDEKEYLKRQFNNIDSLERNLHKEFSENIIGKGFDEKDFEHVEAKQILDSKQEKFLRQSNEINLQENQKNIISDVVLEPDIQYEYILNETISNQGINSVPKENNIKEKVNHEIRINEEVRDSQDLDKIKLLGLPEYLKEKRLEPVELKIESNNQIKIQAKNEFLNSVTKKLETYPEENDQIILQKSIKIPNIGNQQENVLPNEQISPKNKPIAKINSQNKEKVENFGKNPTLTYPIASNNSTLNSIFNLPPSVTLPDSISNF